MGLFGSSQPRIEDLALVTGRGRYIDDIDLLGMLHVVLARSQVAHGHIKGVDIGAATALPGVAAVFTADDLEGSAKVLPDTHPNPVLTHPKDLSVLAFDKVRYFGEPFAAVLAEDRYIAEDAAELATLNVDLLPAVIDLEKAAAGQPALVHDDVAGNVGARMAIAKGDVAAAFASAAHIVKGRFDVHRGSGQAIETRGCVANYDRNVGRLVVWSTTQVPFVVRAEIARVTGLSEDRIQVISPDVGGGFGYKGFTYVEDVLIPWLAVRTGRPVKWIEDRYEHLIAGYHERSQIHDTELAIDARGVILGVRGSFLHDAGAYSPWGPVVPLLTLVNVPAITRCPPMT